MKRRNKLHIKYSSFRCFFFTIAFVVVLFSCSRRPSYVIAPDTMIDVLHDIQIVQAIYQNSPERYRTNASKDSLVNGVFAKYNITQIDFDTSLVWYSDNVKLYREINDSVMNRLKNESQALSMSRPLDVNSIPEYSILPSVYYLTKATPLLPFRLDSFSLETIDLPSLRFEFDVQGINKWHNVEAAMYFIYRDTTLQKIQAITENKHYLFDKPAIEESQLKGVSGYIRMKKTDLPIYTPVVIYNIRYELPKDTMVVDSLASAL